MRLVDARNDMAPSSGEDLDDESQEEEEWLAQGPPDDAHAEGDEGNSSHQLARTPMQKRRRVTRACDECRRKKIKCDGKQPCTHCTVYSYDCTYDQPSHRRRNPGPQYVEALEHRLHRAEALLRAFVPDLDMYHPSLDAALQQGFVPSPYPRIGQSNSTNLNQVPETANQQSNDPNLESMVRATGQLDVDERGYWDYHGPTSGMSFLRRMRDRFGELDGPEQSAKSGTPYPRDRRRHYFENSRTFRSGDSPSDSAWTGIEELPSREVAIKLCGPALDDATAILRSVHQPTFYKQLERIYALSPDQYENADSKFLPLLYTVLALGCLFAKSEGSNLETEGYQNATDIGYKYFWAARELMDITDCRDLTSLQAVIFMILFLQCSAKLSTCYSYVGVALRSALRLGLHRSFTESFNPIESEVRKRVFWVIRKMDIYCAALLGLPQTLSDEDIDQDYPAEVDDECITETEIKPMPAGRNALIVAANANFKLNKIISKIVRFIYPIKGFKDKEDGLSRTYSVSYTMIREIENDLQLWMEDLPPAFLPSQDAPPTLLRIQQLLRMSYAHAQMMLYRPFLHYLSASSKTVDQRSYACAAACVSVSQNIVHITTDMKRRGLLVGSYWFTMYTTFFGILSLVYFAVENPENAARQDVMRDALEGKETLAGLAKRSAAADRCTATLTALFKHLSGVLDDFPSNRQEQTNAPSPDQSVSSQPTTTANASLQMPKRASTFPRAGAQAAATTNATPRAPKSSTGGSQRGSSQRKRPKGRQPSFQPETATHDDPITTPAGFGSFETSRLSQNPAQLQQQQPLQPPQQHLPQHSPHATHFGAQQHSPFLPQQYPEPRFQGELSHMSAMMFPSGDPFAYPNQPMTTLEQTTTGSGNKGPFADGYSRDMFMPDTATATGRVSSDDQIDVQLFGPLPPYMHQSHQQARMGPFGAHPMMDNETQAAGGAPTTGPELWNQQARTHGLPGMNLDNIFGDDAWGNVNPDDG